MKGTNLPLLPLIKLSKDEQEVIVYQRLFMSMIGSLFYFTIIHVDINFLCWCVS